MADRNRTIDVVVVFAMLANRHSRASSDEALPTSAPKPRAAIAEAFGNDGESAFNGRSAAAISTLSTFKIECTGTVIPWFARCCRSAIGEAPTPIGQEAEPATDRQPRRTEPSRLIFR
jgi:hypothetical protein